MAAAARVHVAERGHHAGKFALLVTGGGGPLHGCEVARRLGINRVLCPPGAGVASALGLLMAPARIDRMATIAKRVGALDWDAFESAYRKLEDDARGVIAATLANPGVKPTIARAADLRFVGQGFEIVTDLPSGPYTQGSAQAIRDAFFAAYRQTFGQVPPVGEIEVVNIRVAVTATAGNSDLRVPTGTVSGAHAVRGTRKAWVGAQSAYADVPVYERESLAVGQVIAGPGVIQEASSTLVLPSGARATVDASGSIVVDLGFEKGFTAAPSAGASAAVQ
jgi:N-methylhydantoinase A